MTVNTAVTKTKLIEGEGLRKEKIGVIVVL